MGNLPENGREKEIAEPDGKENTAEEITVKPDGKENIAGEMTAEPDGGLDLSETQNEIEAGAGDEPDRDSDAQLKEQYGGLDRDSDAQPEEGYAGRGFGMGFFAGFLAALICVCVFLLGWTTARRNGLRQQDEKESAETENIGAKVLTDYHTLSKLDEIQNLIEKNYLWDVDSDTLSEYLFLGIAYGLGDKYSNYYSPPRLNEVLESSRGEYFGIGITIEEDTQTQEICVVEVYDGSPAAEAGLEVGDVILVVNDVPIEGQEMSEVSALIKAQKDVFTMKVLRAGTQELEVELECDTVEPSYVESEMLEKQTGYVRITDFTGSAVGQFREALEALDKQGMEKLIIDLRDNPGGLLDSVNAMLDEILPEGLIVYTEDKNGEREEFTSDKEQLVDCEIAVLVNGGSASASEIFAGAVQDYGLGPVVGTQTYGKGVVQDTFTLSDGSAFKMTTKAYYTPKGQNIDGNGITPDIVVEDEALSKDGAQEEAGSPGDSEAQDAEAENGSRNSGEAGNTASGDAVLAKALEVLWSPG